MGRVSHFRADAGLAKRRGAGRHRRSQGDGSGRAVRDSNPTASTFYIIGPAFERRQLTSTNPASNPLRTPSGFSVDLPSLAVRVALSPGSYRHPVFTIGHDFVLRGVERDEHGNAHVISRSFGTSFIVSGVCALRPELGPQCRQRQARLRQPELSASPRSASAEAFEEARL